MPLRNDCWSEVYVLIRLQKLAAKDLDDWEQKRVKRLKGEHDGII